jgi:adenine-specific DNA-methyltransferase
MIKYLGSKRLLLDDIYEHVQGPDVKTVLDVFSGTARVGHHLKKKGLQVFANDLGTYAAVLASCYVSADYEKYHNEASAYVRRYNENPGRLRGYFTETFCEKSRFFKPENGERVDFIREDIETLVEDPQLKDILLAALMEAADRVDSTCGIQMAYLKSWAPRAHKPLELRVPELLPASPYGDCEAYQLDALDFVKEVSGDAAYLDPPYNQHSYLGNYHVWETLCKWDRPEDYGIACKRVDVRTRKSKFNRKKEAAEAFKEVIDNLNVKKIVVSFNDEGFISKQEMEGILSTRGPVQVITKDYKRYVGAQIGIHNPQGKKVGQVSHLRNKEYLYVVEVKKGK